MGRKYVDIVGKRFGRLVVIEKLDRKVYDSIMHKCVCDCGQTIEVPKRYLTQKKVQSCGCFKRESHTKHNLSQSRLYNIFYAIKKRCYNSNCKAFKDYGERGIKMYDEWENSVEAFCKWAMDNGYRDDLTIERIDVNGNYEPNNCKWIPRCEQSKNTRKNVFINYNGKTKSLSEWGRELNIPINTLSRRFRQYKDLDMVFYKGNTHKIINERKRNNV